MRKRTLLLFLGVSICSWAAVTYMLLMNYPLGGRTSDGSAFAISLEKQIDTLEQELVSQKRINEVLFSKLHRLRNKSKVVDKAIESAGNITGSDHKDVLNGNQLVPASQIQNQVPAIAVLLFACNRVTVKRSLDQLLKYRPSASQFPIIVSQDCGHGPTAEVIHSYGDKILHIQQPDLSDIPVPAKEKKFKGYFKISRHYRWALNYTFNHLNYQTAIIVEDDLDIAPDFFEYFLGTYQLLQIDPSLWCVSAWNDNGKKALVNEQEPELMYRTDFFPGLGWMMTKSLWGELQWKWPKSYWDDWMRQPQQRKDRSCIRPEISRTRTFGKIGVSNGLFYEKYLKFIRLNENPVPFTQRNLSYLLKDNYDAQFVKQVYDSPVVSLQELKSNSLNFEGTVRILYRTKDFFKKTAKLLGIMDDFKSGVPRTGYRGVVSFMYNGRRVYLAPSASWHGYDPSWS